MLQTVVFPLVTDKLSHTCQNWSRSCPCAELAPNRVVGKLRTAARSVEVICLSVFLLNSPGPLAFFSNLFFLNFHSCFSFWKNSYQKFHDEFARLYAFLLTATFPQISVFRFSLWPLHHVCYADGISSCTDPAAGPGWAEAALILSILSITLPACWAAQTADYRILKVKDKTKHIFRDLKGWN